MRHFEAVEVEIWILIAAPIAEILCRNFFSMPINKRLRHGVEAKISSVYKKFLHPRMAVSNKYTDATKNDVLEILSCHLTGGETCV